MSVSALTVLKSSRLAQLGLALTLGGLGALVYAGFNKVPERASLQTVDGVLTSGKQVSKTTLRRGQSTGTVTTSFELGVKQANGSVRTVYVPGTWVARPALEAVMNRPVKVEVDDGDSVFAMAGDGKTILAYEASAKGYDIDNKRYRDMGAPALAFGVPLLLIGFFWKRRSLARPPG